ncbi:nuclear transport factor 2 family protein [Leifsonia poae]|uniref:nuclear transport factor 2 family protein n=1 Tax=Leifsonia poae TaxID=110933 RepID=UPI0022F2818A|nr:nuclear transport factor 2 family protein [Leifsonia poae]
MTTKGTTVQYTDPADSSVDELHGFVADLYAHLADRGAFDARLDPGVTVWETADPRLLHGIAELDELRGPAIAPEDRTTPLPLVEPTGVVADRWGDTGVIRYLLEVRATAGAPVTELVRVTDVVRRGDDGWRIVHHHATDIDPTDAPAGEDNR